MAMRRFVITIGEDVLCNEKGRPKTFDSVIEALLVARELQLSNYKIEVVRGYL